MNPAIVTIPPNLDVTVVDLRGKLMQSEESELHDMVTRLSRSGSSCVVFSLPEVRDIETFGLDALLAGCASIAKAGGGSPPQMVNKCVITLLDTTGLCEFLAVPGDNDDDRENTAQFAWSTAALQQAVLGSEYYLG